MPRDLTIEFLPKQREENGEVDGTLPLVQHLIQLLILYVQLSWETKKRMNIPTYAHERMHTDTFVKRLNT
jgi:hypothetical protein